MKRYNYYFIAIATNLLLLCGVVVAILLFSTCNSKVPVRQMEYSVADSLYVDSLFTQAEKWADTKVDTAYAILKKIESFCSSKKYYEGLYMAYFYLAKYNANISNNFEKAWAYHDSLRQQAKNIPIEKFEFFTPVNKAFLFQGQQLHDSAIAYFLKGINNSFRDAALMPGIHQSLAILFYYQGNYRQSIEYQQNVLMLDKKNNDTTGIMGACTNLYGFCMAAKDTIAARTNILTALSFIKETNPLNIHANIYLNTGEYYMAVHQIDSSIKYFNLFLAFVKNRFSPEATVQAKVVLAKVYMLKKELTKSATLLAEASSLYSLDSLPVLMRNHYYETQSALYKNSGNITGALKIQEAWMRLKEEIYEEEKNTQLLEYDRKEKDLAFEKKLLKTKIQVVQKNNNLKILSVAGGGIIFSLLIGLLYWRRQKKTATEKVALLIKEKQLENENAQLLGQLEERSRISQELHDELGATMTSISLATELMKHKINANSVKELEIVSRSSKEMTDKLNEIVWSLNANNDTMQSLVAYIRKFASGFLQEAGIVLVFEEITDKPAREVNGMFRRNMYHTTKEAIHNIVKHANATKAIINIKASHIGLNILIKDNGKGINSKVTESWNNGLNNMKTNMKRINGSAVWKTDSGTEIELYAPWSNG